MVSFRRKKGSSRSYPITPRSTIYQPASDQRIARETHARSLEDSRRSAEELQKDFDGAKTREKKVHVWRATQEEANRLQIGAHNMRNSPEARLRLGKEERVFRARAERMHDELYG